MNFIIIGALIAWLGIASADSRPAPCAAVLCCCTTYDGTLCCSRAGACIGDLVSGCNCKPGD